MTLPIDQFRLSFGSAGLRIVRNAERSHLNRQEGSTLVDELFQMVTHAISSGRLTSGTRLPSVRALALSCGISRDTAVRSYNRLVAQGWLEAQKGSGFYVREPRMKRSTRSVATPVQRIPTNRMGESFLLPMALVSPPERLQSRSGAGYLPPDWFDQAELHVALRNAVRTLGSWSGGAGDPQGYLPLREQLSVKLHDIGISADPANLIVTMGATDALNLIVQLFLTPGDKVLVEEPTQPILLHRLMMSGIDFEVVPRLPSGPDLDRLRELCSIYRPRLFFVDSTAHNPTSGAISPYSAFELLRIAEEFDLKIVEDDTYGDLASPSAPNVRLASLDQFRRVIYVGSFSKTLPAELRIGYIAASSDVSKWLQAYRTFTTLAVNDVAQRAVHRLLSDGFYRRHAEQLRTRLATRRPQLINQLRSVGFVINGAANAGMFIWARHPHTSDVYDLAKTLLLEGHLIAPGTLFSSNHAAFTRFNVAEQIHKRVITTLTGTTPR